MVVVFDGVAVVAEGVFGEASVVVGDGVVGVEREGVVVVVDGAGEVAGVVFGFSGGDEFCGGDFVAGGEGEGGEEEEGEVGLGCNLHGVGPPGEWTVEGSIAGGGEFGIQNWGGFYARGCADGTVLIGVCTVGPRCSSPRVKCGDGGG